MYSEDIDIKDLEKYFLASSQRQAPGFSPKNFITSWNLFFGIIKSLRMIKWYKRLAWRQLRHVLFVIIQIIRKGLCVSNMQSLILQPFFIAALFYHIFFVHVSVFFYFSLIWGIFHVLHTFYWNHFNSFIKLRGVIPYLFLNARWK